MWDIDIFDRLHFMGSQRIVCARLAGLMARSSSPGRPLAKPDPSVGLSLGQQDLDHYLQKIMRFRPVSLYGYSRALYLLACKAAENGFRCDSLKLLSSPESRHFRISSRRLSGHSACRRP